MTKTMTARSCGLGVVALLAAMSGCAEPDRVTGSVPESDARLASTTYGATLLECPASSSASATRMVGPLGGDIEVRGHRVKIPLGAVLRPTELTLHVPESNYLEIDVRAGSSESFQFMEPVTMTINYDRCTRSNIDGKTLRAYYVDGATKEILADLGGVDDKESRSVTFTTDHLSDYAVGAP